MKSAMYSFIFIIFLLFFFGCASTRPMIYEPEKIKEIKTWSINFKYEPGEIERKIENDGNKEVKITTGGRPATDLQLKDDITYLLRDEHEINLEKDGAPAQGIIFLNPVHFFSGGFKSVDVSFEDKNGLTLARVRVQNGNRNATFKDDYSFAEYVTDAISEIIKQ